MRKNMYLAYSIDIEKEFKIYRNLATGKGKNNTIRNYSCWATYIRNKHDLSENPEVVYTELRYTYLVNLSHCLKGSEWYFKSLKEVLSMIEVPLCTILFALLFTCMQFFAWPANDIIIITFYVVFFITLTSITLYYSCITYTRKEQFFRDYREVIEIAINKKYS